MANSITSSSSAANLKRRFSSVGSVSFSHEMATFTKNLPLDKIEAIQKKWNEIDVENLADELVKDLSRRPYTSPIFSNPDIEFIALYAANQGKLSLFEASNLLIYKSACDLFGKDNVHVHFLPEGLDPFVEGVSSLTHFNKWKGNIADHIESLNLPRHQKIFFSVPEEKSAEAGTVREALRKTLVSPTGTTINGAPHRFIPSLECFEQFLKLPYPESQAKIFPVVGVSPLSDFENFLRRPVCIPFSLAPPPALTDSFPTGDALNFYAHDLYHMILDKANPYLPALQELYPVVQAIPFAKVPLPRENGTYPPLAEMFLDRQHILHATTPHIHQIGRFWRSLRSPFETYGQGLLNQDPKTTKTTFTQAIGQLIDHIGNNHARWIRDYKISLHWLCAVNIESACTDKVKTFFSTLQSEAMRFLQSQAQAPIPTNPTSGAVTIPPLLSASTPPTVPSSDSTSSDPNAFIKL